MSSVPCLSISHYKNVTKSTISQPNHTHKEIQSMASSYKKFQVRTRNPNPKSSALLVIDMQNAFSKTAKPIITHHQPLSTRVHPRDLHAPGPQVPDYGMLAEWWGKGELILDGTHGSELLPEVGPREGELVVEKSVYGAFTGTQLEKKLKEMGVEEVIVTGVMTNLCCETTAREAFVRGFRVFFSSDATATSCVELHEATLMNMAYGFAYLVDSERLNEAFFGSNGGD